MFDSRNIKHGFDLVFEDLRETVTQNPQVFGRDPIQGLREPPAMG